MAGAARTIAIVGATATGKSALALRLAEELGGELINADALQVYRGLDIGTGKPTPAERARVPHHLIDVLEPSERYSAGEFARRARAAIERVRAAGGVPIVVGGSGLYQRALFEGLAQLPAIPETVRCELRARLERRGLAALRGELLEVDPASARRIAPGDSQRTLRALEVWHSSGETWSSLLQQQAPMGETAARIGLTLPRAILYHRIESRVHAMMAAGWLEEVRTLVTRAHAVRGAAADTGRGLLPTWPALQAIGYRQLARVVLGAAALDRAVAETIAATRRYAKRQETWFRHERGIHWIDANCNPACLSPSALHRVISSSHRLIESLV